MIGTNLKNTCKFQVYLEYCMDISRQAVIFVDKCIKGSKYSIDQEIIVFSCGEPDKPERVRF